MKRLLIDYKKLDAEIAALLLKAYPDGYGDEDIIAFKNAEGEIINAVELRTEDTLFLVKISSSMSHFMAYLEEELENQVHDPAAEAGDIPELELDLERELEEDPDPDF